MELMPHSDNPVLGEIVRRLVAALKPERVYLYGSRARDEADSDSDVDIMVIIPDSELPGFAFRSISSCSRRQSFTANSA